MYVHSSERAKGGERSDFFGGGKEGGVGVWGCFKKSE